MSTKPAAAAGKNQADKEEDDREAITLPGSKTLYGIGCRKNEDGTKTWFPKTTVALFSPGDHATIKYHIPAEDLKLLETNLVEGISEADDAHRKKRLSGLPEPSPEWKESLDLYYSIQQASDKEYLFVAKRHFEKHEVVAVAHLTLGGKSTCVMESYPARVDVDRQATIDVCRGKSERALYHLLKAVRDFFDAWASFQIQLDTVENGGLDSLSCNYTLCLPVLTPNDSDDLSSNLGSRVAEYASDKIWGRPTLQMCKSWGYETTKEVGRKVADNETLVLVCKKP